MVNAGAEPKPHAGIQPCNAILKDVYARRNRKMPCSNCPDEKNEKSVEEEVKQIQYLLAEAHVKAKMLIPKVQCQRCLARISLLIEGLEIFSKMNVFADAYRSTTDKWRNWITRMYENEIGPTSLMVPPEAKKQENAQ